MLTNFNLLITVFYKKGLIDIYFIVDVQVRRARIKSPVLHIRLMTQHNPQPSIARGTRNEIVRKPYLQRRVVVIQVRTADDQVEIRPGSADHRSVRDRNIRRRIADDQAGGRDRRRLEIEKVIVHPVMDLSQSH